MSEPFKKFDEGKIQYGLVPPEFLRDIATVLTHGANKYGANNWKEMSIEDQQRIIDAVFRHLEAYRLGEPIDKESGQTHLAHAATNILFLMYFTEGK